MLSCSDKDADNAIFEKVDSTQSGIYFENRLDYDERLNTYTYKNFYNGAGVAIGDINNDGLADVYFAGNLVDNKLFLNKGDFQFEDITQSAGVACTNTWSTGVSMADVNGDGLLDIFVCKSGPLEGEKRHNQLFINNGDLTFSDQAEAYGVAEIGLSIHAAFLDYDRDGDLDFYLLNNSTRSVGGYDLRENQRQIRDPYGGNKLYRNDGGHFTDVSEEAGIYGSAIGFGLGVTVADINQDGWSDIFVSNDFFERDYLYLNNQDGTFTESLEEMITETSMGSMGADVVDLNGDGYPEIYVTEMLPESNERVKTKTLFEDWNKYKANVRSGYFHQFTRNTLQQNLGPRPDNPSEVAFSEVSRLKNVHATDWSWGALMFDYDNDSKTDIFVANGIFKDLTDQDYINFYANNVTHFEQYRADSLVVTKLIDAIPSVPLENYLFKNEGDFNFSNVNVVSGLSDKTFSNGAAYGDLDNDGDLDLIVSNINAPAILYKNHAVEKTGNGFLEITFDQKEAHQLFGTRVRLISDGETFVKEYNPVKGYMSSMDHVIHFGLGKMEVVDTLEITWPDDTQSTLTGVQANQRLSLSKKNSSITPREESLGSNALLEEIALNPVLTHRENEFSDFDRDRLLFQMNSNEGPALAVGDINGDGLDDLFMGGSKGNEGIVSIQEASGSFLKRNIGALKKNALSEDVDASFVDLNGDGQLDLLVASGGYEYSAGDPNLQDRVYLNDGNGNLERMPWGQFPSANESSSFIKTIDFDNDGDKDLVSGTRNIPFAYGVPGDIHLYENKNGRFAEVKGAAVAAFSKVGLITDGKVVDIDSDGDEDLVVAGEWMPVKVFVNDNGSFTESNLPDTEGLWHSVEVADMNNDGRLDIIAGNHGLNSRLKADKNHPLTMNVNDFDQNGSVEQIFTQYEGETAYPTVLLPDLVKQLPSLRKKYLKHESYKDQTLNDLFDSEVLENALRYEVKMLESTVFLQQEEGSYEPRPLPVEAQVSQVFSILVDDVNEDGLPDLILAGNQTRMKPEIGINNGSYGLILTNQSDGIFEPLKPYESGLFVRDDVRQIRELTVKGKQVYLFARSNAKSVAFRKRKK